MFGVQSNISVDVVDTAHFHSERLSEEVTAVFSKTLQEMRGGVIPVQAVAERFVSTLVGAVFCVENIEMMTKKLELCLCWYWDYF